MIRPDMRITNVETIILRLPEIELRADGTQDAFIVRLDTDEGVSGYGEADTSPSVAAAFIDMPSSHSMLVGMRETLIGRDPFDIEPIWLDLYETTAHAGTRAAAIHTISAIDIALHDLVGRALGQPVHRLLGGLLPRTRARVCERSHARVARRGAAPRHDAGRARAPGSQARLGPARPRRRRDLELVDAAARRRGRMST